MVSAQGIYVPDMMLELTTPRVLIMEWIEGRRLRRAGKNGQGPSRAELQEDLKLVEIGVQCSLEQACVCPAPHSAEGASSVQLLLRHPAALQTLTPSELGCCYVPHSQRCPSL